MNEFGVPSEIRVDELDEFVRQAAEIGLRSHAERNAFLLSRHMAYNTVADSGPASDPFSAVYAHRVLEQWKRVSGLADYAVGLECDTNVVADERQLRYLYPYSSRDTRFIAEYWLGVYAAIKLLADAPNTTVIEYGVGWGNMTCALLQSGYNVTAIDIDEKWLRLAEMRADQMFVRPGLRTHHGVFGDMPPGSDQYGAVIFYECFHHALAHDEVIRRIVARLAEGGLIILAAEAIYPNYPVEWGLRQDGHSLWAIRRFGWMELGFGEDYIIRLMRRHNLALSKHTCPAAAAFSVTYLAQFRSSGVGIGRSMLTASETGFYPMEFDPDIFTRFTNGDACLEIPGGTSRFSLELKNWLNVPLACELSMGGQMCWSGFIKAGELLCVRLDRPIRGYFEVLSIRSDCHVPSELGINDDMRKLGVAVGHLLLDKGDPHAS
jgi:2-polyprenyl-3-methyl-5-hydroxy-6-metoxy-1,4-benzoquinol methylase